MMKVSVLYCMLEITRITKNGTTFISYIVTYN